MDINIMRLGTCFLFLLLTGCHLFGGRSGTSASIRDSKKKGAFIKEYTVPENPYRINDSLSILIDEAWLEYEWTIPKYGWQKVEITSNYKLCLSIDEMYISHYLNYWRIGYEVTNCFTIRRKGDKPDKQVLALWYDDKMPEDIETFNVLKGVLDKGISNDTILGHFELRVKK